MQRRTVKDLVADYLRQGLAGVTVTSGPTPQPNARVDIGPGQIPTVRCDREAPASRMNVESLLRMEQVALAEEELQRAGMPR